MSKSAAVVKHWLIGSYDPGTNAYKEHFVWKIISNIYIWFALVILIICLAVTIGSGNAWKDGELSEYQPTMSFDPSAYARFYVGGLTVEVKPNGGLVLPSECTSQPAPRESTARASYVVLCNCEQAFYMLDSNDWGFLEIEAVQVIRAEVDNGSGQYRLDFFIAALVLVFVGVVFFLFIRSMYRYKGKLEKYIGGERGRALAAAVNRLSNAAFKITTCYVVLPLFFGLLSVVIALDGGVLAILF